MWCTCKNKTHWIKVRYNRAAKNYVVYMEKWKSTWILFTKICVNCVSAEKVSLCCGCGISSNLMGNTDPLFNDRRLIVVVVVPSWNHMSWPWAGQRFIRNNTIDSHHQLNLKTHPCTLHHQVLPPHRYFSSNQIPNTPLCRNIHMYTIRTPNFTRSDPDKSQNSVSQ